MTISTHSPIFTIGFDTNSDLYYTPSYTSTTYSPPTEIGILKLKLQNLETKINLQNIRITELEDKLRRQKSKEGCSTLEIL